jgi:hypothetical protein
VSALPDSPQARGHKGPQTRDQIASNLRIVERLKKKLLKDHGEELVRMWVTERMTRDKMIEVLLPNTNMHTARSALRYALAELIDKNERVEIGKRHSLEAERVSHVFTDEDRRKGAGNRVWTKETTEKLLRSRGDVIWTRETEEKLLELMIAGKTIHEIANVVSLVLGKEVSINVCYSKWEKTTILPTWMKASITKRRQAAFSRGFTDEERERGHTFTDEDRVKAKEVLGVTAWNPQEDEILIEGRKQGKTFREIAEEISTACGTERSTSACTGRYYNSLNLGTKKRKRRKKS